MRCLICTDIRYYLNAVTQLCVLCSSVIPGCERCTSAIHCTQCGTGYTLNGSNLCNQITCAVVNCDICINSSTCYLCNYLSSYYLSSNACLICDNTRNMYINMTSPTKECRNCSQVSCGPTCLTG